MFYEKQQHDSHKRNSSENTGGERDGSLGGVEAPDSLCMWGDTISVTISVAWRRS